MTILFNILTVSTKEAIAQSIDNLVKANTGKIKILLHINKHLPYDATVGFLKQRFPADDFLYINPQQYPTSWGKITHAIVANLIYAYRHIQFDRVCIIPFNGLQIRSNIHDFYQQNTGDIFCDSIKIHRTYSVTPGGQKKNWVQGQLIYRYYRPQFWVSRFILKPLYNSQYYWGSPHEGISMPYEVIRHLLPFEGQFRFWKSFYMKAFEEVFFPTWLHHVAARHGYTINNTKMYFVDYDHDCRENIDQLKKRILMNRGYYFYKWVPVEHTDPVRIATLKFIDDVCL